MAFIREYMNEGDPFRFRLPKIRLPRAIRKFQPGKAALKLAKAAAPIALNFIPGATAFQSAVTAAERKAALRTEEPAQSVEDLPTEEPEDEEGMSLEDQFLQFARSYGLIAGDPAGKPKTSKLGSAASQPSVKAKQKRQTRAAKQKGGPKAATSARPPKKGPGGFLPHSQQGIDFLQKIGGLLPGSSQVRSLLPGMGHTGGHRRSINPANVKALRRSLRRIEGFEKMVKRVQKAYPRLRHVTQAHMAPRVHKRGR